MSRVPAERRLRSGLPRFASPGRQRAPPDRRLSAGDLGHAIVHHPVYAGQTISFPGQHADTRLVEWRRFISAGQGEYGVGIAGADERTGHVDGVFFTSGPMTV